MTPDLAGLEALFRAAPARRLAPEEHLFRAGQPAECLYLIETGRLRLLRPLPDGERLVLHTGAAGELFAEAALFAGHYHCDAVAATPARVRACAKPALLAAADPPLLLALLARVTRQLHHARALLELRNIRSAEARALQHLRLLADAAERTEIRFDRPLLEVAGEIGLTHEAYYRALAALDRQGRIARQGRVVRLLCNSELLH